MKKSFRYSIISLFICCISLSLSAQQKHLLILQTSDTHSQLEPVDQAGDRDYGKGGALRRTVLLEQMRKEYPQLLLFDCGDFCQGTPYYNMFKGNAEIDMMNEMKYDAATIGNHEFDLGLDNMARIFKRAKFPIVSSNYDFKGTVLQNMVKPYLVFLRQGIRIGVFALDPKLAGLVQAKNYGKIIYKDPIAVANKMSSMLRRDEKCDVVVCLSHLGIDVDKKMIPQTQGIDVVLGGHSHTFLKAPLNISDKAGKSVLLVHSGSRGVKVGEVDMTLEAK